MSVRNNPESIYNFEITSMEDLERALNYNPRDKERIADAPYAKNLMGKLKEVENALNIVSLFKEDSYENKRFIPHLQVLKGIEEYRSLLGRSLSICSDIIPMLISALKSHQLALNNYANPQKLASAMAAMSETGEIGKIIANKYNDLSAEFNAYKAKHSSETLIDLVKENCLVLEKQRDLETRQKNGETLQTDPSEEPILQMNIASLRKSIVSAGKIQVAVGNVYLFWAHAKLSCHRLGGDMTVTDPEMFKVYCDTNEIKDELENSYFNWLALAKVNLSMCSALGKAISELENY